MDGCQDVRIDLGTWIKGDTLSELTIKITQKDENDVRTPWPLQAGDTVDFELRSLDRPGVVSLSPDFSIVDLPTAKIKIINPGANWTPVVSRIRERIEAFIKINRGGQSGYAYPLIGESFLLTLRTAP